MNSKPQIFNFKLNPIYLSTTILLFLTEILIAINYKHGFIRFVFGDFLVVILIYSFIKSFLKIESKHIAIGVLLFAYGIEFLQLINILDLLNIQPNTFTKMLLGSTFSIEDMIAYTFGVAVIYSLDRFTNFS